jgi:hypothetical protein
MRVRRKWGTVAASVALVLFWACSATPSGAQGSRAQAGQGQEIRDGTALLRAMHGRYANNWYETLTFQQDSITHNPDGTNKTEVWYEALILPGKLRIDIGQPNSGNGTLVADNTLVRFRNNTVTETRPFVHMLLVLGFDVYRQTPETTIEEVRGQGFDLSKLREDTWEGRPVYVVGADKAEEKSKQFWIEKDSLLFVRLIQPDEHDPSKIHDSRFEDYRKLSEGFVAARVDFFVDGKNTFSEVYSDIKANPRLDPGFFDPKQFKPQQNKSKE